MYSNKFNSQAKKKTDYMPHILVGVIIMILFFKDKLKAFFCTCSPTYTNENPGPITHPDFDLKGSSENVVIDVEDFERSQDSDVTAMQPLQLSQMYFPATDSLMLSIKN